MGVEQDTMTFASASADHTVKLWDQRDRVCQRTFKSVDEVNDVALSPGGYGIVFCLEDGSCRLFDTRMDAELISYNSKAGRANATCVSFIGNGRFVISGHADSTVQINDALSGDLLCKHEAHAMRVSCLGVSTRD